MKIKKYKLFCFLLVIFILANSVWTQSQDVQNLNCIHSFNRFAYEGPRDPNEEVYLPQAPWEVVTDGLQTMKEKEYFILDVALTRDNDLSQEIWLKIASQSDRKWLVYTPQTHEAKFIPVEIQVANVAVHDVYVDNKGVIWGALAPSSSSKATTLPVLSVFNESQQQFELIDEMFNVPINSNTTIVQSYDKNVIWVVVGNDALYAFDTDTRTIQKKSGLLNINPIYATSAHDGSLYFSTRLGNPTVPGYSSLKQEKIYQFSPEANELIQVTIPDEWPIYRGLLSDSEGRLWLGSIGFRDTNGRWNLLYPNSERFFKYPLTLASTLPTLLFESSDGRLWYTNWWDGGIWYQGTAWYDPSTRSGCMITNLVGSILEDTDRNLWMAVNGSLYRYALYSQ